MKQCKGDAVFVIKAGALNFQCDRAGDAQPLYDTSTELYDNLRISKLRVVI